MEVLILCVSTLWALQERRFSCVYNIVMSNARSLVMGLASCIIVIYNNTTRIRVVHMS
ncbi:hypothetical protein ACHQM5_001125 [Ranunculus cassubicifolius]